MRDWPDLGAASALLEPLSVVQVLQRGSATPATIAQRCGVSAVDVSACLWAFQSAGLLLSPQMPSTRLAQVPASPKVGGLLSRLAAHFGLIRA